MLNINLYSDEYTISHHWTDTAQALLENGFICDTASPATETDRKVITAIVV